jgi:hypothetical protein
MHTTEHLLQQYLDVFNSAMTANADHFPWKQIVAKGRDEWEGKNVGIGINSPDGGAPETYTIRLTGGNWTLVGPGKVDTVYTWEADRAFLEKVAANPQEYITSPMKINWDWVKSMMGIGPEERSASGGF